MTSGPVVPIAITMGDASGVGPELVLRRAVDGGHLLTRDVVVVGDLAILERGRALLGVDVAVRRIEQPDQAADGALDVIDLGRLSAADHRPGQLDASSGAAALAYVERATDLALGGSLAAMVTMPMNKEATQLSMPDFVGHTEFIADRCGAESVAMMLTAEHDQGTLAVTHVSTHCSLRQAIERATTARVGEVIRLTHEALVGYLDAPRIAVCGLNPHAGEHGLFGTEDIVEIRPAIERAIVDGIDATGPHPADTVFFQAVHRGRYDAIVVMYHDQGHAPMKLLAFDSGVNVTLGLPIIRTSVDHGTAFDIAWTGQAFTDSLDHALAYAVKLAGREPDG